MRKKLSFTLALLFCLVMYSCSNDDFYSDGQELENEVSNITGLNSEKSALSEPIESNPFSPLLFDHLMPVYRSHYAGGSITKANYFFSCIAPPSLTKDTYYNFRSASYKYEGLPFYTFSRNDLYGGPNLMLLSKYDADSNNDYLIAIPDMNHNPPDMRPYEFCGYIYSSFRPGLVPLREYYNSLDKNSYYIASEEIYSEMGTNFGNMHYQKILGYVVQNRDFGYSSPTYFIVKFSDDFPTFAPVYTMKVQCEVDKKLSNGQIQSTYWSRTVSPGPNNTHYFSTPTDSRLATIGVYMELYFGPGFPGGGIRDLLFEPEYMIDTRISVWNGVDLHINQIGENIYVYNFFLAP